MITKNVISKIANIGPINVEKIESKVIQAIKNDLKLAPDFLLERSPKLCDVLDIQTSPIEKKIPKALISHEQAWKNQIDDFSNLLEERKFFDIYKRNILIKTTPGNIDLLKKLTMQKTAEDSFRFKDFSIREFARFGEERLKRLEKVAGYKNLDDSFRFNENEINSIIELGDEEYFKFEKLADTLPFDSEKLMEWSSKDINVDKIDVFRSCNKVLDSRLFVDELGTILLKDGVDVEKLLPRLKQKAEIEKDNLVKIVIGRRNPNSTDFHIEYDFKDGGFQSIFFNQNGKILCHDRASVKFDSNGNRFYLKKTYDARNNTFSTIKYLDARSHPILAVETRVIKDKAGKVIRKDYLYPSEVEGVYNVHTIDSKGKVKILSQANMSEDGLVAIKRNFESLDGTKTHYEFYADPKGNRLIDYKIVDKDGKLLLNNKQVFEVIDENTIVFSSNGKSFEMKAYDSFMNIRNLQTNEIAKIDLNKVIGSGKEKLIETLKKINPQELMMLEKSGVELSYADTMVQSQVFSSKTAKVYGHPYVLEHELGHIKEIINYNHTDFLKDRIVSSNPEFIKIYTEERKAFVDSFPYAQQRHVKYFINEQSMDNSHIGEVVAEANALLNGYCSINQLAIRAHYFQQYFPRSIAKAAELLKF